MADLPGEDSGSKESARLERARRSGSSPSAHGPSLHHPSGGRWSRDWLRALVLAGITAVGCSSAKPAAEQPRPSIGQSLSLGVALKSALAVGDATVTAEFGLVNNGS